MRKTFTLSVMKLEIYVFGDEFSPGNIYIVLLPACWKLQNNCKVEHMGGAHHSGGCSFALGAGFKVESHVRTKLLKRILQSDKSRLAHLEKFSLTFSSSSFAIRV